MKLHNLTQVEAFKRALSECTGDVYLQSVYGDRYNLKSLLSQYTAITILLSEHGDELELWCMNKDDEQRFNKFFVENPEVID